MKYLSFVRSSEKYRAAQPPAALMEAMGRLIEKFSKEGALVDTGGLAPSKDGFRMRLENGTFTTTDGPFAESKEVIGGWVLNLKAQAQEVPIPPREGAWRCILTSNDPRYGAADPVELPATLLAANCPSVRLPPLGAAFYLRGAP